MLQLIHRFTPRQNCSSFGVPAEVEPATIELPISASCDQKAPRECGIF